MHGGVFYSSGMSTLSEIAAAADLLPPVERAELIRLLEAGLDQAETGRSRETSTLNKYGGTLKGSVDPLEWQREIRAEWG
jgi:hypothetical protein